MGRPVSDALTRIAALERRLARLERGTAQRIAFARSTAPASDSGAVQTVQGQVDAVSARDAMPVMYHYGFTASLPPGGDHVVVYRGADRSSGVVIATGHQSYRMTGLASGEMAIYDMWGRSVKLGATGITINANGVPVVLQGDLHVSGNVIAGYGGTDQVGLQTHIHPVPGINTSAPSAGT